MTISSVSLSTNAVAALNAVATGVEVKQYDGKPDLNRDGVQKYAIKAILNAGAGEPIAVTVASATPIALKFGQRITFNGFKVGSTARGLWFSADSVEVIQ